MIYKYLNTIYIYRIAFILKWLWRVDYVRVSDLRIPVNLMKLLNSTYIIKSLKDITSSP